VLTKRRTDPIANETLHEVCCASLKSEQGYPHPAEDTKTSALAHTCYTVLHPWRQAVNPTLIIKRRPWANWLIHWQVFDQALIQDDEQ